MKFGIFYFNFRLLIAFVKDIRYEFYEFYPEVLKELILLLKVKDPEILELTFTCLAYLFKYLSRELVCMQIYFFRR